jgi:hypothetical protein
LQGNGFQLVCDAGACTVRAMFAKLLREPLIQFLLIGALLYGGSEGLAALRRDADRTVVVDKGLRDRLIGLYRIQYGTAPTAAQAEALVQRHVREEVLYREALRLRLDRDDEIVRRRLVQKMEFLNHDLAETPEPADAELRRHFAAHAADYAPPATVSFHHLYFSPDRGGAAGARQRAEAAARALATGAGAEGLGDPFPLQAAYADLTRENAAQAFGDTPLAAALFTAPEGRWSGPLESGYGWHLLYVDRRAASPAPAFEDVKGRVRDDVLAAARAGANAAAERRLMESYRIVREDRR